MAGIYWQGEQLRATFQFPSAPYVAVTNPHAGTVNNWIINADFSLSDGNARVNPLGVAMSNSASLTIYDADDDLSPGNTSSPYYGETVNGVVVILEILDSSGEWQPYGTWRTVGWAGRFFDGGHDAVQVSLEDELDVIGSQPLPQVAVYENIKASDLITTVLTGAGIPSSRIIIDPALNQTISYGIMQGSKVRDFINSMCQMLFARVLLDRKNNYVIYPALTPYTGGNAWTLTPTEMGATFNRNEQAVNYSSVELSYFQYGGLSKDYFYQGTIDVTEGENIITLPTTGHVVGVEQIDVISPNTRVLSLEYTAYQQFLGLNINVSNSAEGVQVSAIGFIRQNLTNTVTAPINNASIGSAGVFEFDSGQLLLPSQAQTLAEKVAAFVSSVSRSYGTSGTPLSPFIYPGDSVTISGTQNGIYDGEYKVTGANIKFAEGYDVSLTFIRVQGGIEDAD